MTRFLFNNTIKISALTEREANNIFKVKYPGVKIENSKVIREELHIVNNIPTIKKMSQYDNNNNIFYRFQSKFYEIGLQSWGMIYSSAEEAIEDGSDVLEGKSCCDNTKELYSYRHEFDRNYVVLIAKGDYIGSGHDNESVININDILEIWDYEEFCNIVSNN